MVRSRYQHKLFQIEKERHKELRTRTREWNVLFQITTQVTNKYVLLASTTPENKRTFHEKMLEEVRTVSYKSTIVYPIKIAKTSSLY